jgi:hypothetical protein
MDEKGLVEQQNLGLDSLGLPQNPTPTNYVDPLMLEPTGQNGDSSQMQSPSEELNAGLPWFARLLPCEVDGSPIPAVGGSHSGLSPALAALLTSQFERPLSRDDVLVDVEGMLLDAELQGAQDAGDELLDFHMGLRPMAGTGPRPSSVVNTNISSRCVSHKP